MVKQQKQLLELMGKKIKSFLEIKTNYGTLKTGLIEADNMKHNKEKF